MIQKHEYQHFIYIPRIDCCFRLYSYHDSHSLLSQKAYQGDQIEYVFLFVCMAVCPIQKGFDGGSHHAIHHHRDILRMGGTRPSEFGALAAFQRNFDEWIVAFSPCPR